MTAHTEMIQCVACGLGRLRNEVAGLTLNRKKYLNWKNSKIH
jgi:hypothetical protein